MFLPVRPEYNDSQGYVPFSHDPFLNIIHRNDVDEIRNLIEKLNENRLGTAFLNYHGQISQEKFLKIYEAIPRSLKYAYLTIRDRYGNTILHYFAKEGAFELVRETFSYLEDVEKYHCTCFKNDIGQTPLH
ncbi:MAG: hypothetical protein K940chlam4_00838 [Candidatus Anoxychlamydiales bacterium]|nr:hypothetical protein [Candidatus Anoxychlamydiales bacterium]